MKTFFILPFISLLMLSTSCAILTKKEHVSFRIYSQEDQKIMKVKRSGTLTVSGEKLGILRPDGVLTNLENDTLAYQDVNGVVYSREHEILGKVDEHGAIEMVMVQGDQFSWTADGKLQLNSDQSIRVEPNFKIYYDKASFLFIVYVSMNDVDESEGNEE